ncbi:MAG: N-acetylmuramoyl-L-alanine amidase [Aquidulcibacter sp.]|nr:N-acetylmuramoyl-L-alanine amidase [Aquidulcibacter sp.]
MYKVKTGILLQDGRQVMQIPSPYGAGSFSDGNPEGIIMHYTAGGSGKGSANYFASNPDSVSAHFVIERDGTVIQCRRTNFKANHAGKSSFRGLIGLNNYTIGIEIANRGFSPTEKEGWLKSAHKNQSDWIVWWEPYPDEQIRSVIEVSRALRAAHPTIKWIAGHDDIAPGRKIDPGPAFPMQRVNDGIMGDGADDGPNTLKVNSKDGLNLRAGPSVEAPILKNLANRTEVQILGSKSPWVMVSVLGTELSGWVHGAFLE